MRALLIALALALLILGLVLTFSENKPLAVREEPVVPQASEEVIPEEMPSEENDALSLPDKFSAALIYELKGVKFPDPRVVAIRNQLGNAGELRLYGQMVNRSGEIREQFLIEVRFETVTEENYHMEAKRVAQSVKQFEINASVLYENKYLFDPENIIELDDEEQILADQFSTNGRELLSAEYLEQLRAHASFRTMRVTRFLYNAVRSVVLTVLLINEDGALNSHTVGSVSFDALRIMSKEDQDNAIRGFLQKALEVTKRHEEEKKINLSPHQLVWGFIQKDSRMISRRLPSSSLMKRIGRNGT